MCPKPELQRQAKDVGPWTLFVGLRISDLRKSFTSPFGEKVEVLRGIDLAVAPGEMIAITGPSGSGKSTLLQLIGGLEEADHGTICLDKVEINRIQVTELPQFRRRHFGFVFQFHHLLTDLTAVENVALPLMIGRCSTKEAVARATRAIQELGLGDKGLLPVGHLSGGEQQKVAVARALIGEPTVVLADEPTGSLDQAQGEEIAELLRNYCRRHEALVIVATHNPELGRICDRIFGIRDGKLRDEFTRTSEKRGLLQL
jgi:lipoprotein-releasing system ATP-binding protein